MIIKKPLVTIASCMGMGLLVLFSISYIWLPLIQSSEILMAIAEALGIVLGLITLCFVVMYYSMKKRSGPAEKQEAIVSRMPKPMSKISSNENGASVISMPMTG